MTGPHVVVTGPIQGTVTAADGTEYDVSADQIEVESPERALEVAELIGQRYEKEGHPLFLYSEEKFRHVKRSGA